MTRWQELLWIAARVALLAWLASRVGVESSTVVYQVF